MNNDHADSFRTALERALAEFGIEDLPEPQFVQLVRHYLMLHKWNNHINLTRIIEPDEAARLHYAESVYGGRFVGDARTILDVGSGAGFPAVPLAVCLPGAQVTALEANQKKALFLNEVKDELALANFTVARARLEEFDTRPYDLVATRALDRAEAVLPSLIKSLGAGQRLMLFCAPDLLAILDKHLAAEFKAESHPLPQAEARLIALISRLTD